MAKTVNDAVHQNYGLAIRKLVSAIVADSNSNKHAHAAYHWFLRKARKEVPECNLRLASKFAIVYAAGRLAHRYQLAPWTRDGLREAVFTLWRRSAEPAGDSAAAALEVVSNLEALSEDRSLITKLKKGAPLPEAAIGLHRSPANAPRQIVFVPERLAARIGRREMLAAVRYLDDQGVLIKGRGRSNKRQVRIAGLP